MTQSTVQPGPPAAVGGSPAGNVAFHLSRRAAESPHLPAVIVQRGDSYRSVDFAELEEYSNRIAAGLTKLGIERGMKTVVLVRPGIEFVGVIFALFKMGAVPVLIDPGMGVERMLECLRHVEPQAMIAVPMAHLARRFRPQSLPSIRVAVSVGHSWFGGTPMRDVVQMTDGSFRPADTRRDETAAILFTSGATGPAKGVVYEHGMFDAQVRWIQSQYAIAPGEVDLSCFPLFALFCPALGMTSVIPQMDATRPGRANPRNLLRAITEQRATSSFGSPALWQRLADFCVRNDLRLPTLRRVLIAGAPVSWRLLEQLQGILSDGADVHTPYGATEALPVASISGRQVLGQCVDHTRAGAGICVGPPLPGIDLRIMPISEEPLTEMGQGQILPAGQIGEIVVAGEVVTRNYANRPDADAMAKIADESRIWHRMGDIGYLDDGGRLWYCGRKAHRVQTERGTMYTIPCESILNEHPAVSRSALVGVGEPGRQRPVAVIEPRGGRMSSVGRLEAELRELAGGIPLTSDIADFLFRARLPVDVRHNAKINREALAVWAAERLR